MRCSVVGVVVIKIRCPGNWHDTLRVAAFPTRFIFWGFVCLSSCFAFVWFVCLVCLSWCSISVWSVCLLMSWPLAHWPRVLHLFGEKSMLVICCNPSCCCNSVACCALPVSRERKCRFSFSLTRRAFIYITFMRHEFIVA